MKNIETKRLLGYIDNFIIQLKLTNKSKHTISSYKNTLNCFYLYILEDNEDFCLESIKKSIILGFFEYKQNSINKQGELSPNTKKLLYTHLKSFFKYIEK